MTRWWVGGGFFSPVLAAAVLATAGLAPRLCMAADPERAVIQWHTYMQTPEFVDVVNKYAAPDSIQAESSKALLKTVSEQCGFDVDQPQPQLKFADRFKSIVAAANDAPSLDALLRRIDANTGTLAIALPICVPQSRVMGVTVGPGDNAGILLLRYLGEVDEDTIARLARLNHRTSMARLKIGETIQMPVLKKERLVTLRSGLSVEAFRNEAVAAVEASGAAPLVERAEIVRRIGVTISPYAPPVASPPAVIEVASASVSEPAISNISGIIESETVSDPLDYDRLKRLMEMNERLLGLGGITSLKPANVAVVDGLFDMQLSEASPFKSWINTNVDQHDARGDILENLEMVGTPPDDLLRFAHGIGVVFQVGGGSKILEDEELHSDIDSAVQVSPFGYYDLTPSESGNPDVVVGNLSGALTAAGDARVSIINFSGGEPAEPHEGWDAAIDKLGNVLFVAAAGNDRKRLDDDNVVILPARLGGPDGNYSANVLTVGALRDGLSSTQPAFWDQSNLAPNFVDLLAPGYRIPIIGPKASSVEPGSGTSLSAPMVTFVGALVQYYTQGWDPRLIKSRLVESARMEKSLEPYANQGSVLDLDAVSVYLDAMRFADETGTPSIYGIVVPSPLEVLQAICTEVPQDLTIGNASRVRRIHVYAPSPGPGTVTVYWRKDNQTLKPIQCQRRADLATKIEFVKFDPESGSAEPTFKIAGQLRDITYSMRLDRNIPGLFQKSGKQKGCPTLRDLKLIAQCGP